MTRQTYVNVTQVMASLLQYGQVKNIIIYCFAKSKLWRIFYSSLILYAYFNIEKKNPPDYINNFTTENDDHINIVNWKDANGQIDKVMIAKWLIDSINLTETLVCRVQHWRHTLARPNCCPHAFIFADKNQ